MLKIEISNEGNATTKAEGKAMDLLFQSTVAVAAIIEMAERNFGKELPDISDFIIAEAQRVAKEELAEKEHSKKHSNNPVTDMLHKIFKGV